MNYPLISEYIEAIKAAEDNFEQLKNLRPVLDEDGEPVMTSGNFAVVFKMKDEQTGKLHAVKCFLKEQEGRAEAYRMIAEELEYVNSTFLTPIKYLDKELFVDSKNSDETEFPVLLMDWVEGKTLDKYIREHIDDQHELSLLAYQFSRLAMWLMPQSFAHGDLKPDNILVKNDGTLVLVDYDGMYVPAMKDQKARELGSPDFRHPNRTEADFDEHIDDFSLVNILLSLKAISLQPSLLEEYGASDRLLFSEKDYRNLSESQIMDALKPLMQEAELASLYSLYILALSQDNLSQVSFRLFNLSRPDRTQYEEENLSTEVTDDDLANAWTDEYGVKYSEDRKRLLISDIDLSEYTIKSGTKVICDYAFDHDWYLDAAEGPSSIVIPNSVVKIGANAFSGCDLSSLYIPASVRSIGIGAFSYNKKLDSIIVDNDNKYYNSRNNCNAIIESCSKVLITGCNKTIIPEGTIKITSLAFAGSEIENVYIPDSIIDISFNAFLWCKNLCTIEVNSRNHYYDSRNNCNAIIETKSNTLFVSGSKTEIPKGIYKINDRAFAGSKLSAIIIPDSVKEIGEWAFSGCKEIKTLAIPNSIIKIKNGAFSECVGLEIVNLGNSIVEIGHSVFEGCTNLKSVIIPDSVQVIGGDAFKRCYSLTSIKLGNSIGKIGYGAFFSCHSLTSLYIPERVKDIGKGAFVGCYALSSIKVNENNSYYDSRNNCNAIIETSTRTLIAGCLNTVIPEDITSIGEMAFAGLEGLKNVIVPNNIEKICNRAYSCIDTLKSINIPESVTKIEFGIVQHCVNLELISVDKKNSYYNSYNNCNAIIDTNNKELIAGCLSTIIPDGVLKIGHHAFCGCANLHSIIIPNDVEEIEAIAFWGCEELTAIHLPNGLKKIDKYAFENCNKLKIIYIPIGTTNRFEKLLPDYYRNKLVEQDEEENLSTEVTDDDLFNAWIDEYGVKYSSDRKKLLRAPKNLRNYSVVNGTKIICDKAFLNCDYMGDPTSDLQSIVIANSVKAIGDYCFGYCSELSSIKIYYGIETIGTGAFRDCTSIEEIQLPKSLRTLGPSAFRDCTNLRNVRFDCLLKSVPFGVFSGCLSLINIDLPISIETIENYAFYDCENLESISFPPKTKEIGDFSFKGCESLTSIIIPEGVTKIGGSAFSGCASLIHVSLPDSINEFGIMYEKKGIGAVESLSVTSFDNCEMLESIYISKGDEFIKKALWRYENKLIERETDWMLYFSDLAILKMKLIEKKSYFLSRSLGSLISSYYIEDLKNELINWEFEEVVHFWEEVKINFLFDDINSVTTAEVVDSNYGYSVCFLTNKGEKIYVPLIETSALSLGDTLDMNTAKVLIIFHKDKDNMCKIVN